MGVLAVRLQKLDRILEWDGPNMQFTNISNDDKVSTWSEMFDIEKMMAAANASAKSTRERVEPTFPPWGKMKGGKGKRKVGFVQEASVEINTLS